MVGNKIVVKTGLVPMDIVEVRGKGYEAGFEYGKEVARLRQEHAALPPVSCAYFSATPDDCARYRWISADPHILCCRL